MLPGVCRAADSAPLRTAWTGVLSGLSLDLSPRITGCCFLTVSVCCDGFLERERIEL